jgi:hypothetical protein
MVDFLFVLKIFNLIPSFLKTFKNLAQGKVLTEKESILVKEPQKDLVQKNVSFLFKINGISNINDVYEVTSNCQ